MSVAINIDHVLTSRQEQPPSFELGRDPNHPIGFQHLFVADQDTLPIWQLGMGIGDRDMRIVGVMALLFGLATILAGGRALFGDEAAREAAGAAVPFVLWFNFLAGFAYVLAGIGLLMRSPWAISLSILIATATVMVFMVFGAYVFQGGGYEMRTVGAMVLRSVAWIAIAISAYRALARPSEVACGNDERGHPENG
jgi:hypothetical protein